MQIQIQMNLLQVGSLKIDDRGIDKLTTDQFIETYNRDIDELITYQFMNAGKKDTGELTADKLTDTDIV
jgi:hypothetical protein